MAGCLILSLTFGSKRPRSSLPGCDNRVPNTNALDKVYFGADGTSVRRSTLLFRLPTVATLFSAFQGGTRVNRNPNRNSPSSEPKCRDRPNHLRPYSNLLCILTSASSSSYSISNVGKHKPNSPFISCHNSRKRPSPGGHPQWETAYILLARNASTN